MDLKAVGKRIKAAREQKGLTQEALAELVNLSPMHVSVIERGFKPTKMDTFCNIANALDVSADTLLQDVIDHSADSVPSDLDDLMKGLPAKERRSLRYFFQLFPFYRFFQNIRHFLNPSVKGFHLLRGNQSQMS